MALVGVIGLGVAGLPTAANFGLKFSVKGVDREEKRVNDVNNKIYTGEEEGLLEALKKADIHASMDIRHVEDCDLVILCLPSDSQNFTVIDSVLSQLNSFFRKDVVISSTVYPSFTRKMQEKYPNIKLSYVPIRTFEGKAFTQFLQFPHVIGVFDGGAYERVSRFYRECGGKAIEANPPEKAELTKLFSNSFRQNEMAISNELAFIAKSYGQDPREVFHLANEGDPNRRIKTPGVWGGYCLGKDTIMLSKAVEKDHGYVSEFLNTSEKIRLDTIRRKADEIKSGAKGGSVCIEGIACKPIESGSTDIRSSPVLDVVEILKKEGMDVKIADPNLPRDVLEKTASNYSVGVATKEDFENCSVIARFENYDLTVKKTR